MRKWFLAILACVIIAGVYAESSYAIPALARKYKSACTDCHSLVPYLNDYGREFKLNGYAPDLDDYSEDVELGDDLALGKQFPISARFKSKTLIVPDDGDDATKDIDAADVIHEFELLFAGRVSKRWSAFAELEFESEDGFAAPGFAAGAVTYHNRPELNVQIARAAPFHADPYNSLSDARRLTLLKHPKVLDWKSKQANVADERMRKPVQQVNVHGRVAEKLFYMVGVAAARSFDGGTNLTGQRPRTVVGRAVVDVAPEVSIGGFVLYGKEGDPTDDDTAKFGRFGATVDGEYQGLVYKGVYSHFTETDETTPGAPDVSNDFVYLALAYAIVSRNNHPLLVPQVTFNSYEDNAVSGTTVTDMSWKDIMFALSAYVTENVRVTAEFWRQLDVPDTAKEAQSFLLGADIAF